MKNTAHKITHLTHHPRRHSSNGRSHNKKALLSRMYTKPVNDFKVRSKRLGRNVARYTTRQPLKTLSMVTAIGVFSGFVLGFLSGRK